MSTQRRASQKSRQSFAGTARSSASIAPNEKVADRSSQGPGVQQQSAIRSERPAYPRLSKTLRRVPVRLPRWISVLKFCQCAFAAIVLGAGVTGLTIGGRAWLQPVLLTLTAIACPTFLVMITSLSALPKIMRWNSDHRLRIVGNVLAMLVWGMSFSAACAIENAGAGTASMRISQVQALTGWTAAIMAACASGIEFLLFLASTLVTIYYYHLALVDYKLFKFKAHVTSRQKILALEEPLPRPNPAFRKSSGPMFPPPNIKPKVPQRSSLRAIAHLNNQAKYPGLKSKLSKVSGASKSLEELGLEASLVPLPDSPPLEVEEPDENSTSPKHTRACVNVPVFMAPASGTLPLRGYSDSPLNQEVRAIPSPDSAKDSAVGVSPVFGRQSLLDLVLKSPRVPPKERPNPLMPINLPTPALSPKSEPKPFSAILSQTSWPLPAVSADNSRSASFSSAQKKTELAVPQENARASSFSSAPRRTDLIVPLENPRLAPLSPAQKKKELARKKDTTKEALNQEKEELAKEKSMKKEIHNQEKQELAKEKSMKKELLTQEKNEIVRLKSLKSDSSAKEKSELIRLKSLKREGSNKSPGSASFAENAKRFSTLAPSFRIGKSRPRPTLTLKNSNLAPLSTTDDSSTAKRRSWTFGRPESSPDSPPLTSLTFSNWALSNASKDDIAAPPPSPATLAASIKTNATRTGKRVSFHQKQKQKKAARAKEAAIKLAQKELKKKEESGKRALASPEAERYYTRSPYDFDSSSEGEEEEFEGVFAMDTNCVPGSASRHPLFPLGVNWSEAMADDRFGDGCGDGDGDGDAQADARRSISVYSHQGSQSVYSVDTNGFPPGLLDATPFSAETSGLHRIPMSSLRGPAVTPLFHRVSLNQFVADARENAGLGSPGSSFGEAYEEEIEGLAREFLDGGEGGV